MSNESAVQMLWGVLETSKNGQPYLSPVLQYQNLIQSLSAMPVGLLDKLYEAYQSLVKEVKTFDGFENLHVSRGGIVNGGDDAFYMDFPAWVVAQGKELYTYAKSDGAHMIRSYAEHYNVPQKELRFENLIYPFSQVADIKRDGKTDFSGLMVMPVLSSGVPVEVFSLYTNTFDPENMIAFRFTYKLPRQTKDGATVYWSFDILASDFTDKQKLRLSNMLAGSVLLQPYGDLYLSEDEHTSGLHSMSLAGRYMADMLVANLPR